MQTAVGSLRDYQLDVKSRLCEAWRHCRNVMVQMPTGTGKTHVLASVVESSGEGTVVIVTHRRELVAQAEETMARYGISREAGRVRVLSIQWLSRHLDEVDEQPGWVIIDEAHHARARSYQMLWEKWPQAKFLGLTATPCRMDRSGFTDLFDTLVTSWSIAEFIRKGRLAAFDYVSIRPDSREQLLVDSLEKRGADGDYQVKEMEEVLNRDTSIGRLYDSVKRFAGGKKGIVYAVSISHARRIAAYYSRQGICATAIDSRTPAAERRRLVEAFKEGKIQVLVNVDVFSEGFDCPDVEFVQMARPTLSLAKYLQQVGRGLRKTEGKEACVLIDNVGLYRVFGLPTVAWDWEAMFRGEESGKGMRPAAKPGSRTALAAMRKESGMTDCEMEMVVSHDRLLSFLAEQKEQRPAQVQRIAELKAWQDAESGLWGLRRGRTKTTEARFVTVFDIRYDLAAVRFKNHLCGVVDGTGKSLWSKGRCQSMRFIKNNMLAVKESGRKETYIDLRNFQTYEQKPEIRRYGNIELLKVGQAYYSRTQTVYANRQNIREEYIVYRKFFLTIFDNHVPALCNRKSHAIQEGIGYGYVCLLEDDNERFYWLHRRLADGSIIVADTAYRYYHVKEKARKRYIGCCDTPEEEEKCHTEMKRIAELAQKESLAMQSKKEKRRQYMLGDYQTATPFRSGLKWGLKLGERILVPPIYRNVQPPVGNYCAVEKNYSQWGIIAIDGKVLIEPKYQAVDIQDNDMARLTLVTGKTISVKLQ